MNLKCWKIKNDCERAQPAFADFSINVRYLTVQKCVRELDPEYVGFGTFEAEIGVPVEVKKISNSEFRIEKFWSQWQNHFHEFATLILILKIVASK